MRETMLRLDANEGRCALPPEAIAARLDAESIRRYPDARPLEAAIAARIGLPAPCVLATAGADDAIDRAVRALAGPGGTVVSADPSFVEYAAAAERSGARYAPQYRAPGEPFPLGPVVAALVAEREAGRRAIAIAASPDNPGGTTIGDEALGAIAAAGFPVLLDLTYAAFAESGSGCGRPLSKPAVGGVIAAGSLSKAFGLAGLRIGWACGPEPLIAAMRGAGPPFSISSVAAAAGLAALDAGDGAIAAFVAEVRRERRLLESALAALGARTWPGEGNFATAFVSDAPAFAAALAARGVAIRTWRAGGGMESLVRITCPGDAAEFETLVAALAAAKEFA